MALTQKQRHTIFVRLSPTIGEEETEALLSHFPTSDRDELVTVARLDASVAAVRGDIARLEASLVERMRQQTMWTFGALVSGLGIGMGIAAAVAQAIG